MTDEGIDRRDLLRGVAGAAGAAAAPFLVNSVAGQQAPDEGPAGVHVAYGKDPASTLRIGWSERPISTRASAAGTPDQPMRSVEAGSLP